MYHSPPYCVPYRMRVINGAGFRYAVIRLKTDKYKFLGENNLVGAIAIGILAGFLGFIPLFAALRLSRKSTSVNPLTAGLFGLGGFFISLIVLAVCMIVCAQMAREMILPFGLAEMLALIVFTSVYVVYKNVLAKRK